MNEEKKMSPGEDLNIPMIGDGEGEIPLVKQPTEKVDMRTMSSDIASMQETGGAMPRAYAPESGSPQNSTGGIPPTKKDMGANEPPQNAPQMTFPENAPSSGTPQKKNVFWWILGIIILIGILAGIYFFVLPIFTDSAPMAESEKGSMEVVTPPQEEVVVPDAEVLPVDSTATSSADVSPSAVTVPLPDGQALEVHTSLLKIPADLVFDAKLASFGLEDMKKQIEFLSTSIPVFKEVVFKTSENKPVSFGYVTSRLFPSFFTPEIVNKFQSDGTIFSYTNTKGTWLGVIAKLKDGTAAGPVQDSMSILQKSPNLKNIFLTDPGTQGVWKDGKVADKPTSLVSFAQDSAVFSYTWFDQYLLIGTNLEASNEAAKRLGY